jgi:hypothetical protein
MVILLSFDTFDESPFVNYGEGSVVLQVYSDDSHCGYDPSVNGH